MKVSPRSFVKSSMRETSEVVSIAGGTRPSVARAAQAAAFDSLAERHLDAAYRLAYAILRNAGDAQDATHDAFVQAWRKWSTLRDPERFDQWFDRILVNICRNRVKRVRRWQARDISSEISLATPDEYGPSDDRDMLDNAIAALSADHQVVVALRYYRDLPVDEIAARLDIPPGTVQSRLHYALKRLQTVIGAAGDEGVIR
jgi:RNA polymerase sigma-70 factor, ECF subfamily